MVDGGTRHYMWPSSLVEHYTWCWLPVSLWALRESNPYYFWFKSDFNPRLFYMLRTQFTWNSKMCFEDCHFTLILEIHGEVWCTDLTLEDCFHIKPAKGENCVLKINHVTLQLWQFLSQPWTVGMQLTETHKTEINIRRKVFLYGLKKGPDGSSEWFMRLGVCVDISAMSYNAALSGFARATNDPDISNTSSLDVHSSTKSS